MHRGMLNVLTRKTFDVTGVRPVPGGENRVLVRGRSGRQRRLRSSVVGADTKRTGNMTEATGGGRAEMERRLINRA